LAATGTKDLFIREYMEQVVLNVKEGQLNFDGQTLPLGSEATLEISFVSSTPGKIEITQHFPPSLGITGSSPTVRIVLTFCIERLYAVFGRVKSRAQVSDAGDT
jgi:hypothetical protein